MTKIKKIQRRSLELESKIDSENQVIEFSFSSEAPVERFFGMEILSHSPGAMNMSRLKTRAPLLFNHDRDIQIGAVEDAWIGDDKRGYCRVKFSRNAFAQEKFRDVQDGILVNVSFAYELEAVEMLPEKAGQLPEFLATRFCPFEVSLVTIPADITVGIGREMEEIDVELPVGAQEKTEETPVEEPPVEQKKEIENQNSDGLRNLNLIVKDERNPLMDTKEIEKNAEQRVMSILALGEKHEEKELARSFIESGKSAQEFAMALVEKLGGAQRTIVDKPVEMTEKEKKQYSVSRAIFAQVNKDWSKAGFEREVSEELAKRAGKQTEGFFMPTNLQMRATQVVGTANLGGNLTHTEYKSEEFIDILRARAVLVQAGAKTLTGLTSNIAIPKKSGSIAHYWVAEDGSITASNATFSQVGLAPKTVGALTAISALLVKQGNPSIDALITDDMNKELALAIDSAGLAGTGASGQPLGLLNTSGIGNVPMGTNGAAVTYDAMIDLETEVAVANGDANTMKYITNASQVGKLKKLKASGTGEYLWTGGQLNGYDVLRSNLVPSNLTKGTGTDLSAIVFGDFSQLLLAQFSAGIEILVNPYGSQFAKGGMEIRAMTMVDVAVRQAAAFAAITDAL